MRQAAIQSSSRAVVARVEVATPRGARRDGDEGVDGTSDGLTISTRERLKQREPSRQAAIDSGRRWRDGLGFRLALDTEDFVRRDVQ